MRKLELALALGVIPCTAGAFAVGRASVAPEIVLVPRAPASQREVPEPNEPPQSREQPPVAAMPPTRAAPRRVPIDLERAPRCRDVLLRGVVVADDPLSSLSLVTVGTTAQWRRRGDSIGEYRLLHTSGDRAWLVRPSSSDTYAICQADLGVRVEAAAPAPQNVAETRANNDAARGPHPLAQLASKIERRGVNDILLDRSVLDELIENQGALAALVRARPEMEGGRTVGLELSLVKPGSVLEKLGLRSGDRLRRAAGVDLGSVESALTAIARIRSTNRFSMEIVRSGAPLQIDFETR